ncbi:MAG: OmpA family protein [Flavobacteriaceae bacterium]|jgi:OOP family OmpA-OmpF porin
MKHLNSILVAACFFLVVGVTNAQDANNPWAVELGVNAIDVYSSGNVDAGRLPVSVGGVDVKGRLFDEFFNVTDHYNIIPAVTKVAAARYLGDGFSFGVGGTMNKLTKLGDVRVDDLIYYAGDAELRYSMRDKIGGQWLDPSLGIGGGYTWVDDIGFGSLNATASVRFWVAENLAINVQSTFKHAMEDFGITHFQHSIGAAFKFGGKDTDGDGLYDNEDACPEVAGLREFGGCPDSDGDGIEDRNDACVNVAGLAEFNGCPDSDGDGIADPQDACPMVAGVAALNGCPDGDSDGITDADDNCPTEAGPSSNGGCPFYDADNDGVEDKDDKCPDVAGTVSNNGCPEVTIEIINQLNEYSKTILFDTGKTSIRETSNAVLQDMADVMAAYPTASFEIGGHTDSVGRAANNQKLSAARAQSVHDFLVGLGMDDSRLSFVGYGEDRPVADNNTAAGRQENRRVEISLVK